MNVIRVWRDKQRPERINFIVEWLKPSRGRKVRWLYADPGDPLYPLLLDHPEMLKDELVEQ